MAQAIPDWKKSINSCQIPILQSTADFFLQRKSLPATSISMLWKSLEYDPGMCLNLLRAAGHSRRAKVKTVSHAMLMLGLPNVLNRPEELPRIESIENVQTRRLVLGYFSKSYHAAAYAQQWSARKKEKNLEEIHTASLNSFFMEILLCLCQPELMLKLDVEKKQEGEAEEIEKQILGLTIKELAYEIATDWHLPELMIDVFSDKNRNSDRERFIELSHQLCNESSLGWYRQETETIINSTSEILKCPLDSFSTEIHKTAVKTARSSLDIFSPVLPSAFTLNQLPTPVMKTVKKLHTRTPTKKEVLKNCLNQISHNPELNYQEIMQQSFKAMNKGLGLNRIFFALLTQDKKILQVKFSISQENNNGLKRLRLPLQKDSLFERLMRKPQALWMRDENREKYRLMLPRSYIETINADVFFAMSIFIGGKPVGLFFADKGKGNLLTEIQFKYFRQICKFTANALQRISDERVLNKTSKLAVEKKAVNA